jgi:hypothetical protein
MRTDTNQSTERLTRVRTTRRGTPIEVRVHYEIIREDGFDRIRIILIEDAD